MCIEDIRLARKQRSVVTLVNLDGTAALQLAPQDPLRVALTLFPPAAGSYTVYPSTVAGGNGSGIVVSSVQVPILLRIEDIGPALGWEWTAIASPDPVTFLYIDSRLEET